MKFSILQSCKHTLKFLKDLGYKTFDRWISEEYDNIDDENERKIRDLLRIIATEDNDEFDSKGNLTLKNAAQYLSYKPAGKKKDVDEMRYYESVAKIAKPYMEYEIKQHKSYKDK